MGAPSTTRASSLSSLRTAADFDLTELRSGSGLAVQVTPGGAVFAIRHGPTLINQVLPGPAEEGLLRLILRWRTPAGKSGWAHLTGPRVPHRRLGPRAVEWGGEAAPGISFRAILSVHRRLPAWSWRILIENCGGGAVEIEAILGQDLGLGDEGGVRMNEAFNSQYLDLLPVKDPALGWVILARQNQAAAGGRHPWLAVGCPDGAAAFCTDGTQFFGFDHRLTGQPAAVRLPLLPSVRQQYECALAGLQSRRLRVEAGGAAQVSFVARFLPDHPDASGPEDIGHLREAIAKEETVPVKARSALAPAAPSLFVTAPWLHGAQPAEAELRQWFPGEHRLPERGPKGEVIAFFHGSGTHVVTRAKEAAIARPHGHIIRSGTWEWVDNDQFGTTCYASGIFAAQAYLGNPAMARLLPVIRDALGIGRASGQRLFRRREGAWHQLGVPSTFSMAPGEVRWIYRLEEGLVEVRVWCSPWVGAAYLELRAEVGAEFLFTHTLALGPNEYEQRAAVALHHREGWVSFRPDPKGAIGSHLPKARFAIASADAASSCELGGDEQLFADGRSRGHPCAVLRTGPVEHFGVILCGTNGGTAALRRLVEQARREWAGPRGVSSPPASPLGLAIEGRAATSVARVNEVLPWLAHNAAIHFSAPHGLEQQGGGAWGVRDVCQGSLEWLLASGRHALIRRILETVFAQQYARDGSWPQWFMHPPYRAIQQAHSNGDVCFWPVKALCDYLEASNDLEFLEHRLGYTDPQSFAPGGPKDSVLRHCDRVIDQCEERFIAGTALVNYGDGDWDDTLQPADPSIRTRMISAWTVALVYHTFRQLAAVCARAGDAKRQTRLEGLLGRIRADFYRLLMPDATVAGFLITEVDGTRRPLLHPRDTVTGIRYRLLPMTRSVLAELFTPEAARHHLDIVRRDLVYPDGARLMSHPATYLGGCEHLFKRADTAANVGREIGLQYVHAHLRYAEAMAKGGDADRLWTALQVVNPVGLGEVLAHAVPRQSNVYFSSSDADFADRVEAERRWPELRTGAVAVRGGWRLYSSGPGLYLHAVRSCFLGLREHFDDVVFDPVLPVALNHLTATTTLCGHAVEVRYVVKRRTFGPSEVSINGRPLQAARREPNPYRVGGLCFAASAVRALLTAGKNVIAVEL